MINIPPIVIEQRFGDRDVLFEYGHEYAAASFHRVCALKIHSKTHHDRLGETTPLTAFWKRRQRRQTGLRQSRSKAWRPLSYAPSAQPADLRLKRLKRLTRRGGGYNLITKSRTLASLRPSGLEFPPKQENAK